MDSSDSIALLIWEEYDKILTFAMTLTRDREDAEDLASDTVLRAIEKQHLFARGTNLPAWLTTICRNLFYSRYTRRKRELEYLRELRHLSDGLCEPEPIMGPSDQTLEALEALPPEFQEVIILRDMRGLSYQEVADEVSIPIGTVMSRLYRARKILRKQLAELAEEEGVIEDAEPFQCDATNLMRPKEEE